MLIDGKFLDEICSHMVGLRKPNNYWTYDKCYEMAQLFNHKIDFQKAYPGGYQIAANKNWLEDICAHMTKLNNLYSRDIYMIKSLSTKDIYIGLSYNVENRYKDHLLKPSKKVKILLSQPHVLGIIEQGLLPDEASKLEVSYIDYFQSKGFNLMNDKKGGGLGKVKSKWNFETIQFAAYQCSTRTEFHRRFAGAATVAGNKGFLQEILKHLPNKNIPTLKNINNYEPK